MILYPALVQGEGAAASIVNGIRALDALGVDVIIVGRGGGSIEDLWAFNEEIVARAIFECETPVISAVGHETDTTIADYVADLRAPTPSAAAELAVYDYRTVNMQIEAYQRRMDQLFFQKLETARLYIEKYQTRMKYLSPENRLRENRKYAVDLEETIARRMEQILTDRKHRVALLSERIDGVSPLKKLSQGYAYVQDARGKALTDAGQVKSGDEIRIHLLNGQLQASVTEVTKNE